MRLESFSVANYRSITTARKIPLSDYSLLIGANNEGKSNILHALTLGMNVLDNWRRYGRVIVADRGTPIASTSFLSYGKLYRWEDDFPIGKQNNANNKSATTIKLEFQLDDNELIDFKKEFRSNLNGTLPLFISIRRDNFELSVNKPGRGGATLTKKSALIADFVSKRIRFEYIPAVRTAKSASDVIGNLVGRELLRLKDNDEYAKAMSKIEKLQTPILDQLEKGVKATVAGFLPSVRSVKFQLQNSDEARLRNLARTVSIIVDDGSQTQLDRKGDGIQSLIALALMRHASEKKYKERNTVIAIEEPESHLHPEAIHELRSVIEDLAKKNQIVLTSHSPLFVNPSNLSNTIIVEGSKAVLARKVSDIRNALGVRFSDNLENASVVLLVEGTDDAIALQAIISSRSQPLSKALKERTITFVSLGGAGDLRQIASFYSANACLVQAFIDYDDAGRRAVNRTINEKVLTHRDVNLCMVPGHSEAELEDIYDRNVYGEAFFKEFGVNPRVKLPRKKWSHTIGLLFRKEGKCWDGRLKIQVKNWLADFASKHADTILHKKRTGPIDSFIKTVEDKLPNQ